MSDIIDESPPETQTRAKEMGWIPPDRFKGDPEKFVSAAEFVRRGEEYLPFIKAQNRKLEDQLVAARSETGQVRTQLEELNANMAEFTKSQVESAKARMEAERARLKVEMRQARREGDHDKAEALEDQIAELKDPEGPRLREPSRPAGPAPEMVAWAAKHSDWYGKQDTDENFALNAIAYQHGVAAAQRGLKGQALLDYVDEKMAPHLRKEPAASKTEGGGPSGHSAPGSGRKDYNSLPPDAKAQCDAEAKRFVGPNKVYKTVDEARKAFCEIWYA